MVGEPRNAAARRRRRPHVSQARDAIEHTEPGNHVNLVTHGDNGHPDEYLYDELAEAVDSDGVRWEYVQQCGCGGHVTRVYVE